MSVELRKIALQRENLHKNHESSRPLSKDYEYIGLKGEDAFANEFKKEIDKKLRPGGDAGKDFEDILGNIDVKTARKAYNLIVEEGKVVSDVYVLAQYIDETDVAHLLGWEYKDKVLAAPKRDFGYGIINHYIPKHELRTIEELKDILLKKIDIYTIKTPIWKTRSIGIARQRLSDDLLVEIEYKQSNGEKLYPHTYIVRKGSLDNYPIQIVKDNNLVIVPIEDLEIYKGEK